MSTPNPLAFANVKKPAVTPKENAPKKPFVRMNTRLHDRIDPLLEATLREIAARNAAMQRHPAGKGRG